ncbi:unnamed protein product [Caenorhabditis sp. 36 PRJEB53466]|nr:unnamed protein product [Caenorhabditis sp. 36 PRJEB53466]
MTVERVLGELVKLGKIDKFSGEVDYGAEISSDSLFDAMREIGMNEESQSILEPFLEDASLIHQTLLSMTFSNFLASSSPISATSSSSESLKKARRSVRLLLNLVQRSSEFAAKVPSECVDLLETLLATAHFDAELLLFLVKTADSTWLEFQKSPRYSRLLERVVGLLDATEHDRNSTILAYFSTLLEKDYAFLANCYAELGPAPFCAILDVVHGLQSHAALRIHQNNLLFVLNLLELICVDYGAFLMSRVKKEPKDGEMRRKTTVEMLTLLVEIVGDLCANTEMTSHLNEKATVINSVVDVLDTILHSESRFADFRAEQPETWPEMPPDEPKFAVLRRKIQEEQRYESMKNGQKYRPKQPPPSKMQRVMESESLSQLSDTILDNYKHVGEGYHRIGELKLNCLKAIANLCNLSASNKLATVQNGRTALLSVLQCTTRRPEYFMESYAMRNWAIFCVRQLTDECQENKEVILRLGEPAQPIIDRRRLLKEFGILEEDLEDVMEPAE